MTRFLLALVGYITCFVTTQAVRAGDLMLSLGTQGNAAARIYSNLESSPLVSNGGTEGLFSASASLGLASASIDIEPHAGGNSSSGYLTVSPINQTSWYNELDFPFRHIYGVTDATVSAYAHLSLDAGVIFVGFKWASAGHPLGQVYVSANGGYSIGSFPRGKATSYVSGSYNAITIAATSYGAGCDSFTPTSCAGSGSIGVFFSALGLPGDKIAPYWANVGTYVSLYQSIYGPNAPGTGADLSTSGPKPYAGGARGLLDPNLADDGGNAVREYFNYELDEFMPGVTDAPGGQKFASLHYSTRDENFVEIELPTGFAGNTQYQLQFGDFSVTAYPGDIVNLTSYIPGGVSAFSLNNVSLGDTSALANPLSFVMGLKFANPNTTGVFMYATVPDGDYNADGIVDEADYAVWRQNIGSTTKLAADGNGDSIVDAADYVVWRAHSGQPAGSGASVNASVSVPEPTTQAILVITAALVWFHNRRVLLLDCPTASPFKQ